MLFLVNKFLELESFELPSDYPQTKQIVLEQLTVLRDIKKIKLDINKTVQPGSSSNEQNRTSSRNKSTTYVPSFSTSKNNINSKCTTLEKLNQNMPYNLFFTIIPDSSETITQKNAITFTGT